MVCNYDSLRFNICDFRVKRVIGRDIFGGRGEAKLAKETSTGAVYALKVMKKVGDMSSAFFTEENVSPWLTNLN